MANTAVRFGFKHIGYTAGAGVDYQQLPRQIQSTYSTAIGFGDPVVRATATSPYIIQGTAALATTGTIEGVFVGCYFVPSSGVRTPQWSPNWPGAAAADGVGYIIDAPNARFLAATLQTSVTSAQIGSVVNFTTGVPNTTTGVSIAVVDAASISTTAATTLPFKILGLYGYLGDIAVGNGSDQNTDNAWVIVGFNNQINRSNFGF
jgi:hypothetical protein